MSTEGQSCDASDVCPPEEVITDFLAQRLPAASATALEAHLDRCASCRALIAAVGRSAPAPDHADVRESHALLCEQPGRYTIQGLHGAGGQAQVLRVYDEIIGREVALKSLPVPDSENEQRFLREARVTGQLCHPNIVDVYEIGRRARGEPYYTMELIRGQTLAEALRERKTLTERLGLLGHFHEMCNAIAFAHSRGVVHRDIKPSNVMVGAFGETVVLDWGLAKIRGTTEPARGRGQDSEDGTRAESQDPGPHPDHTGERDSERDPRRHSERDPRPAPDRDRKCDRHRDDHHDPASLPLIDRNALLSVDGAILGTPAYMSPEQADGRLHAIDERSDVYALGAVLYEILTGVPPFTGLGRTSLVPVSARVRLAPRELAAMAEKALAPDPEARYQSARELADDVRAYMTGRRVAAYPYSVWELLLRLASRNKAASAATGLALLLALVSLVLISVAYREERLAREEQRFHLSQAHNARAEQLLASKDLLEARVHAAAALTGNPASPHAPDYDGSFAATHPEAREAVLRSRSTLFQTTGAPVAHLRTLAAADASGVTSSAISRDGRLAAVSEVTGTVILWDVDSGRELRRIAADPSHAHAIAFHPARPELAVGVATGAIGIFDTTNGRALARWRGHSAFVSDLAISPDGRLLASASDDRTVRVWDAATGACVQVLTLPSPASVLAFSADSALLALTGPALPVRVVEANSGALVADLVRADPSEDPTALTFVRGRAHLACAGIEGIVEVFDISKRTSIAAVRYPTPAIGVAAAAGWLVLGAIDGAVTIAHPLTAQAYMEIGGGTHDAIDVALAGDGTRFGVATRDGLFTLWRFVDSGCPPPLMGHGERIEAIAVSPDGASVATAGADEMIGVWDAATGSRRLWLAAKQAALTTIAFAPSGRQLASAAGDSSLRVWDTATGETLQALTAGARGIHAVAFSASGRVLTAASLDGIVRIWDTASWQLRAELQRPRPISAIDLSEDEGLVALGGTDGEVEVWRREPLTLVATIEALRGLCSRVRFSPDGRHLLIAGEGGPAALWDWRQGRVTEELTRPTPNASDLELSPDARLVVTSAADRSVTVWRRADREPLLRLRTISDAAPVAFSRDGRYLIVADGATVRFYPTRLADPESVPSSLLTAAQESAGRHLQGFELRE